MSTPDDRTYEFGPFRLQPAEGQLLRNGEVLTLTPKAFETLVLLVERRGRLLEKEELMKALWPDTFVEEANLAHHIWRLRKVLDDTKEDERYIETVPKRGYRFVGAVRPIRGIETADVNKQHELTPLLAEHEAADTRVGLQHTPISASETPHRFTIKTWLLLTVVIAVAVAAVLILKLRAQKPANIPSATAAITTIAVLPFQPLTNESSDAALELGMADALTTRLSNLKELTVRPTSAVIKYSSAIEDPGQVGRELLVQSVLVGRLQRASDRIRVTVQLIRSEDGKPIWAERFDEKFTDIFALEDSLSEKVARALALQLTSAQTSLIQQHYTNNLEAYQSYLRGRYQMNQAAEGALRAVGSFEEAVQKDPNFALAYAGLADVHFFLAFAGIGSGTPGEQMKSAKAAGLRALELDDSLAEAHVSLANVLFGYEWKWAEAEREFKRAIELNRGLAEAHHSYSNYLEAMMRWDESLAEIKRAQELDPLSITINFHHGLCLFVMGHDEEALVQYQKTLNIDSSTGAMGSHWGIAMIYEARGKYDEAIRELEEAKRLDPRPSWRITDLIRAYALAGRRKEAFGMLTQLLELNQREYVSPSAVGQIYAALGDMDQAFAWFNKAIDERELSVVFLKAMTRGANERVREDPRYQLLLQRVGLSS